MNALVGRSWLLDALFALSLDNVVVKAGPIGACFFYAWYRGKDAPEPDRRRVLLVTLAALLLIAPLTKALSESRLAPRPFLMAEQSYVLEDGRLTEGTPLAFRTIQTGEMLDRVRHLEEGRVDPNDLGSFPSDHAAFFVALALGIFLACRRAGAVALAWAVLVTLGSRVASGMHWPVDIAAGALLGAVVLAAVQFAFAGRRGRIWTPVIGLTDRYPNMTAALLFLLLLEAANTMQTMKRLMELGGAIAGRLL